MQTHQTSRPRLGYAEALTVLISRTWMILLEQQQKPKTISLGISLKDDFKTTMFLGHMISWKLSN